MIPKATMRDKSIEIIKCSYVIFFIQKLNTMESVKGHRWKENYIQTLLFFRKISTSWETMRPPNVNEYSYKWIFLRECVYFFEWREVAKVFWASWKQTQCFSEKCRNFSSNYTFLPSPSHLICNIQICCAFLFKKRAE